MKRFVITFAIVLVALFSLEMLNPVQEHLVVPFTTMLAKISAALISPFDNGVIAYGKVLQFKDTGFAVSIEAGCNGVEATIVLIAAVVAYPASWKARISAIALGFLAIQVLNIARIISLFYLGDWDIDIFSWVHLYLWPSLIMLDVLVVFIVYLRYLSRKPSGGDNALAAG
ncbi:exosortase H [Halieaceae bacterium IMCC8485]|uniref:Exosortase H n=1 Tax=Candidatus Seongchinamella marina TaxID=2518990 RepID=A0ABT3SPS2_9GAMM|nr:exosortase H [Candidatus Seongchinamella marina]MCX2971980.1 exosortase H [Candidatus Seongchinamella marina]